MQRIKWDIRLVSRWYEQKKHGKNVKVNFEILNAKDSRRLKSFSIQAKLNDANDTVWKGDQVINVYIINMKKKMP